MKKNLICVLAFFAFTLSFNRAKADSYGYIGASGGAWTTPGNWYDYTTGAVATTKYPGKTAVGDIVQGYYTGTNAVVLAASVTLFSLAQINVPDNQALQITLNSPVIVTGGMTIGDTFQTGSSTSYLLLYGPSTLNVGGASVTSNNSEIYIEPNGVINFNTAATFSISGTSGLPSYFVNYGTTTGVCAYTLAQNSRLYNDNFFTNTGGSFTLGKTSLVSNSAGTFTANSCVFTINGNSAEYVNAATTYFYGCTVDISGSVSSTFVGIGNSSGTFTVGPLSGVGSTITATGAASEVYVSAGTFNLNGSMASFSGTASEIYNTGGTVNIASGSTVALSGSTAEINNFASASNSTFNLNASTLNLSGATSEIYNAGGTYISTFNSTASSIINLTGTNSTIISDAVSSPNFISTFNVTATTINLGSSGGADGSGSSIVNTDESVFYLNAGSIINLNGANTKLSNTTYNGTSTTYYGTFVCASTSVINPTSTTCAISNTNTPTSTTSNPSTCFTLLSDANGSATIGQNNGPTGNITGQFNVQRYMTGFTSGGSLAYRNYRLLACPTNMKQATSSNSNYTNLAYLSANATLYNVTGTYYGAFVAGPGTSFGTGIHSITNPLIYLYQESITPGSTYNSSFTSGKNVGVTTFSSGTSPYYLGTTSTAAGGISNSSVLLPAGNGYLLYYIDWNKRTAAASSQTIPNPSTVTASGYINQNDVPLYMWGPSPVSATLTLTTAPAALVRNPGLTMVGNPYAATLDLYKFYNYASNTSVLNGTFYELNDATQQFPAYNGASNSTSGPVGGSEYVASGQGFYVVMKAAGALTFKENQKALTLTGPVNPSPILESINPDPVTIPLVNSISAPSKASKQIDAINFAAKIDAPVLNKNSSLPLFGTYTLPRKPVGLFIPVTSNVIVSNTTPPITPVQTIIRALTSKTIAEATTTAPLTTVNPSLPAAIHLKLVQDSIQYDECGIYFSSAWADTYDKYDSFDLDGLNPKVYLSSFTSDNVRTAINAMGDYSKGKRIKLYVKAAADGLYQFQLEDLKNFKSAHYNVFLIDNQLHDSLDMGKYKTFNVNLIAADTASYANRFVLAIEHAPVPQYALVSFSGQKISSGVQLDWKTVNEGNYTGFVLQKLVDNTYVSIDSLLSDSLSSYDFIDQHPSLGSNVYRLQQNEVSGNVVYTAPITIGYNSNTSATGNLTVYPNPSKNVINITLALSTTLVPGYSVNIYDAAGTVTSQRTINTTSWTEDVSSYKPGIYIIRIKDKNGNLVGKSKFAKVN